LKIAPPGRATPGAPTIATHVWRLFGASALMVAVLVAALFWDIKHIAALRVATVQTAAVDRELRMLGEALLNAETGQRGYLLTADPRYLEPYQLGATAARKSLAALDESALAPEVRRELPQLARLVDEKLAELEVTVTLTREGHRDAAVAVVAQDHGKVLMP